MLLLAVQEAVLSHNKVRRISSTRPKLRQERVPQCIKGLNVKIVNFMFYKSYSFKKKILFLHIPNFWSIPSKKWINWSKAKYFSLHGGPIYLYPYFETHQVKTLHLIQGFPQIAQKFKYLLFNFVVFLQFAEFYLKAPPYHKVSPQSTAPVPLYIVYSNMQM